ncbi:hypothetical protein Ancab_033444 [Ancistrocladus abbreviatus]
MQNTFTHQALKLANIHLFMMKSSRAIIVLVVLMPLVLGTFSKAQANNSVGGDEEEMFLEDNEYVELAPQSQELPVPSTSGTMSRFLAQKYQKPSKHVTRGKMTCNNYPRMCHVKGSPGPDCCKKKCVNVKTDRDNCGMCGFKCYHQEICCKGRCVNPVHDKEHCGSCGNKCKKGSLCNYGMCSYA